MRIVAILVAMAFGALMMLLFRPAERVVVTRIPSGSMGAGGVEVADYPPVEAPVVRAPLESHYSRSQTAPRPLTTLESHRRRAWQNKRAILQELARVFAQRDSALLELDEPTAWASGWPVSEDTLVIVVKPDGEVVVSNPQTSPGETVALAERERGRDDAARVLDAEGSDVPPLPPTMPEPSVPSEPPLTSGSGGGGQAPASALTFGKVDEALSNAELANTRFEVPEHLPFGGRGVARFTVSRSTLDSVRADVRDSVAVYDSTARVTPLLFAELHSAGLTVLPRGRIPAMLGNESQNSARWEWAIEAPRGGEHSLVLSVYGNALIEGVDQQIPFITLTKVVSVEVGWKERVSGFLSSNWQWVWTAILIPVIGILWPLMRRRTDANVKEDKAPETAAKERSKTAAAGSQQEVIPDDPNGASTGSGDST